MTCQILVNGMDYGAICLMVNVKNSMGPMYSNVSKIEITDLLEMVHVLDITELDLTLHMFYKTLESWYCFYKIMVSY